MFFKNRQITVKVNKVNDSSKTEEPQATKSFESKAEVILNALDRISNKAAFFVLCYVLLDTHRQVSVAKATIHPTTVIR